jgi:VPS62-like protein
MTRGTLVALVVALGAVVAAPAGAAGTGTLVVRLATDPPTAGVSWAYTVGGTAFTLGDASHEHTVADLATGSYTVTEETPAGQAATLTAVQCADPSRDSRGSVPTATATVALAAGETVVCTFTHRALGPRPSAAATTLARQFAPIVRLDSSERYRPIALTDYLGLATLRTGTPPRGRTAQPHPTLFSLPTTIGASYLDIRNAEPYLHASRYRTFEQQLQRAQPRPTVYWRIARQLSTGRMAIEYWFFYLYNDFADRHEGDWEHLTVFVANGAPLGVAYSQHQGSTWSAWPATLTSDHPVVYVAAGSHANYALPGSYPVKVCFTLKIRRCTASRERDTARGNGVTLQPAGYDLQPLAGAGYAGSWGSGTYLLGVGLTKDRVVDPRRRSDYSNPFTAIPPGVR